MAQQADLSRWSPTSSRDLREGLTDASARVAGANGRDVACAPDQHDGGQTGEQDQPAPQAKATR